MNLVPLFVSVTALQKLSMERETGIEPAPSAWKAEVLPLNYSRRWWREKDSNLRRHKSADLQSALVGRLSIPPTQAKTRRPRPKTSRVFW